MPNPKEFPSDKAEKFVVRFPDGMRDRIAEAAKKNGRSMNAEIVQRLAISLDYEENFLNPAQTQSNDVPKGWAAHLASPEHRDELEELLGVVQKILLRSNAKKD